MRCMLINLSFPLLYFMSYSMHGVSFQHQVCLELHFHDLWSLGVCENDLCILLQNTQSDT